MMCRLTRLYLATTSAVHRRWKDISFLCFTHLEQFATLRHFSTIATDFQEEAEAIFVQPQKVIEYV